MSADRRRADDPGAAGGQALAEREPAAPVPGRRSSRRRAQEAAREAERHRQRKTLRRWGPVAGGVALLLVLVAVVVVRGGDDPAPSSAPTARTERTLLLQLVPAVGRPTIGNAILASDPERGDGVFMTVPGRLITEVPGGGRTTVERTSVTADGAAASRALSDQLGVLVDASWVVTGPSLSRLVDDVDGVVVDVDTDVTVAQSAGTTVVAVPKGPSQRLDGAAALAYAGYLAPGEAEQARLARFTAVWTALLRTLPEDPADIQRLVAGSAGSVSTLPPEELATFLADHRRALLADSVAFPTLPTAVVDTGAGGAATYRLDAAKATPLLRTTFADSLPPTPVGGKVTVLVQNGVGTPGLTEKARARLVAAGLTFQNGGNATRFGYPATLVLVPDATAVTRAKASSVAAALGVGDGAIKQSSQRQSVADVLVILGADFRG